MAEFKYEKDGQIAFYDKFYLDNHVCYENYTDGLINGCIFEFKLSISNINAVLFQTIKYLSRIRVLGKGMPAHIFLVDLNAEKAFYYHSQDFIDYVEKVYDGASSKNNEIFTTTIKPKIFDYSNDNIGLLKKFIEEHSEEYTRIHIDENCVMGWAEKYYRENPTKTKAQFFDEIAKPNIYKKYIYPYPTSNKKEFQYLMDTLNDKLNKKELGAFFTPPVYCKEIAKMVSNAVNNVKNKDKYIILDRCAGTGNLEEFLSQEQLKHCILSTYEYFEYEVLLNKYKDKVLAIIPPAPSKEDLLLGAIIESDALTENFVKNSLINVYIEDKDYTVILLENPPYNTDSAIQTKLLKDDKKASFNKSWLSAQMKKDGYKKQAADLCNIFIWSAFKYYLRNPEDSYIVLSPAKYFKSQNLVNKKFEEGYLLNRGYFHAGESAITCIRWTNKEDKNDSLNFNVLELENSGKKCKTGKKVNIDSRANVINKGLYTIKKVHKQISDLYDRSSDPSDKDDGICCELNGYESNKKEKEIRVKKIFNENIIGYFSANAFGFENPRLDTKMTRCGTYDGNGMFLRKSNYYKKLPLFCAGKYPIEKRGWQKIGTIFKTADKNNEYEKDNDFLKSCFIYSCLSYFNKCLSFNGSDKRYYKNELCFDTDTLATQKLSELSLNEDEKALMELWNNILNEARKTKNYDSSKKYGFYQIAIELNTFHKENKSPGKEIKVFDYPLLNTYLSNLKIQLQKYYDKYIEEKLFLYELLK